MSLATSLLSLEQLTNTTQGIATLILLLVSIGSAAYCMMGYLLYRWSLALQGALAAVVGSTLLVNWWFPGAPLTLYLGAWLVSAAVLGLACWWLWRATLAANIGLVTGLIVTLLLDRALGLRPAGLCLLVGWSAAAVAAVLAHYQARKLVVAFTAVTGAFLLTFSLGATLAGWISGQAAIQFATNLHLYGHAIVGLSVLATALAMAGAWCQVVLQRSAARRSRLRTRLAQRLAEIGIGVDEPALAA